MIRSPHVELEVFVKQKRKSMWYVHDKSTGKTVKSVLSLQALGFFRSSSNYLVAKRQKQIEVMINGYEKTGV
jgi:hypothetical protein